MTKAARAATLTLASALVVALIALPGFATEGDDPEEVGETTVVTTDIQPAVEVTTPPLDAASADWTYRYLIPTGIALAILVIIATTGQYFTNVVRKRYRIVEE
jgi:hypothetical protein